MQSEPGRSDGERNGTAKQVCCGLTCFVQEGTFSAGQKGASEAVGRAEPALHGSSSSKDSIQRNRVRDPLQVHPAICSWL